MVFVDGHVGSIKAAEQKDGGNFKYAWPRATPPGCFSARSENHKGLIFGGLCSLPFEKRGRSFCLDFSVGQVYLSTAKHGGGNRRA